MSEPHFFPSAEAALEVLGDEVRRWDGYADGRIRCWVNIEGKEPCSPALHVGSRALAERLGVRTANHPPPGIEDNEGPRRPAGGCAWRRSKGAGRSAGTTRSARSSPANARTSSSSTWTISSGRRTTTR